MHFKLDHNLLIHQNSSLKNLIADTNGLLAACPKPHIDASCIVAANSESKSISQLSCSISFTAFSVPTLHGEHWPQLSSSKKRNRLSAASLIESLLDRMITAWLPTKQPCCSSWPKSSGKLSILAGRIPPEAPPGK